MPVLWTQLDVGGDPEPREEVTSKATSDIHPDDLI